MADGLPQAVVEEVLASLHQAWAQPGLIDVRVHFGRINKSTGRVRPPWVETLRLTTPEAESPPGA